MLIPKRMKPYPILEKQLIKLKKVRAVKRKELNKINYKIKMLTIEIDFQRARYDRHYLDGLPMIKVDNAIK